ncbi:MAG: hypothetical protein DI585_01600 [Pseudomonas fluorescens]|nr:MAG: hypothetical protein DI585_01600 [Pseudomonas fluorescens]
MTVCSRARGQRRYAPDFWVWWEKLCLSDFEFGMGFGGEEVGAGDGLLRVMGFYGENAFFRPQGDGIRWGEGVWQPYRLRLSPKLSTAVGENICGVCHFSSCVVP